MKMDIKWFWFENSEGKPDTMLSFAIMAFALVFVKVLIGGIPFHIAGETYTMLPIDAGTIGALLTPTLTAYVARRYTDKKFDTDGDGVADSDTPKK